MKRNLVGKILGKIKIFVQDFVPIRTAISVLRLSGALTLGYKCTIYVGADVGAGCVDVDVIYISFIISVQYIRY